MSIFLHQAKMCEELSFCRKQHLSCFTSILMEALKQNLGA